MNDKQRECAWGRIEFYTKLLLADLLIFSALVGWLGIRFDAGKFDALFVITCGGISICVIVGVYLFSAIFRHFKNLEANSK